MPAKLGHPLPSRTIGPESSSHSDRSAHQRSRGCVWRHGASAERVASHVCGYEPDACCIHQVPPGSASYAPAYICRMLTVAYAMVTREEAISVLKVVYLVLIVGGVVGLKLVH